MKKFAFSSLLLLVVVGCSSTSGPGPGGTVDRVLAGLGCITALAGAGVQVAGDPTVNGAHTALGVMNAIASVGASNVPASVLAACKSTIDYATQDATGAIAYARATTGTTGTAVQRPASAPASKPPQPAVPTVVTVQIPK